MTIDSDGLHHELDFALRLALEAGRAALAYFRGSTRALRVRDKPGGQGPVTRADIEIDAMCVRAIERRFPDDDVIAEESHSPAHARGARRRWYVDPIDGTRDFVRGKPGWAVLIGLCIDERPVLGIVHEPAAEWTGWAVDDPHRRMGLQCRGHAPSSPDDARAKPLRTSMRHPSAAILVGGRAFPFSREHAIRRALKIPSERSKSVGSVGLRMSMIVRGEADVYVQPPGRIKVWDTCAAAVLCTAGGAVVTDFLGEPLTYPARGVAHHHGVVVTRGQEHGAVLERLAPLSARWLRSASGC